MKEKAKTSSRQHGNCHESQYRSLHHLPLDDKVRFSFSLCHNYFYGEPFERPFFPANCTSHFQLSLPCSPRNIWISWPMGQFFPRLVSKSQASLSLARVSHFVAWVIYSQILRLSQRTSCIRYCLKIRRAFRGEFLEAFFPKSPSTRATVMKCPIEIHSLCEMWIMRRISITYHGRQSRDNELNTKFEFLSIGNNFATCSSSSSNPSREVHGFSKVLTHILRRHFSNSYELTCPTFDNVPKLDK